mgnify:CR=1 FL=1
MSEVVEVFKEKLLEIVKSLVDKNPPKTPESEMFIKHLINRIESSESILLGDIIEYLWCAGYSQQDIIKLLFDVGVITSSEDVPKFRDAIRRKLLEVGCRM